MKYLTELHTHTSEVSPCAHLTAPEVAERFIAAGYHTVTVTNHYTAYIMSQQGESWEARINHFLSGYRIMKEYAGDRLRVLPGAEIRFSDSINDYLVFGLTEDFLISHPNLYCMSIAEFSAFARENGLLFVQAHPFRNGMKIVNPALLDGMEVFNAHPGHDSRNSVADLWAWRFGLLRTSGTDFHNADHVPAGGILTDEPICDTAQLVSVLRSGHYLLHCSGPIAEQDGILNMPVK